MTRLRMALLVPTLGLLAGACANSSDLREGSQLLAAFAASHAAANKEARARYDELNSDLARINDNRRQRADLLTAEVSDQSRAWALAGKKPEMAIVAEGARVSAGDLAIAGAPAGVVPPLDPSPGADGFATAIKAARDLGKTPTLAQRAKSLVAVYGLVHAEIEKGRAAAAKSTSDTAATAPANALAADHAVDPKKSS